MSGHSKWHSIRHKKAAVDAKRGKLFTKLIKEIVTAARLGGGDTDMNPRLRTAVQAAKDANMPSSNIEKAIKKGTGELPGTTYEDIIFEGYGPCGVAIMVEVSTDNHNRATAEIRHIFSKYNGNLGENGCVSWMFTQKGLIIVEGEGVNEDDLMLAALDAGAEDIENLGDEFSVTTDKADFHEVREKLEEAGLKIRSSELSMIPNSTIKIEGKQAEQLIKLVEMLEDNEDVQKVSANFDIDDEVLEQLNL